jgi:multiple RNA-binding domain-containing protein 1
MQTYFILIYYCTIHYFQPGTTNEHRGFCFVDFLSVGDAKKAFESLVHSTHLYGRRLVLEWAKNDSVEELIEKSARKVDSKNKKEKPASKKKIQESIGNVKQY